CSIALSSAEAELVALTLAGQYALGLANLLTELNIRNRVTLYCDSSSAMATMVRRGLTQRLRHLSLRVLFLKQIVQQGVTIKKIAGSSNPADLGTKCLSFPVMLKLLTAVAFQLQPTTIKQEI